MIPRIIWRTCPRQSELPSIVTEHIGRLKALNPHWNHIVYDDDEMVDYIASRLGHGVVDCIRPEYRVCLSDLWRYLVVYEYGGLYLDIKSTAVWPLDEVVREDDACLLSRWTVPRPDRKKDIEWQQWFLCAEAEHEIMYEAVLRVVENIEGYSPDTFGVGRMGVLNTTGPVAFSHVVDRYIAEGGDRCRVVYSEKDLGLVYSVYEGIDGHWEIFGGRHYSEMKTGLRFTE